MLMLSHHLSRRGVSLIGAVTVLVLLLVIITIPIQTTSAQDSSSINLGENKLGELSAAAPIALYTFNGVPGQRVDLQVVALAPGMVPAFAINSPAQQQILPSRTRRGPASRPDPSN